MTASLTLLRAATRLPQDALDGVLAALRRSEALMVGSTGEVRQLLASGGRGWLVEVDGEPAGCALLAPLPGLAQVYQLSGGLLPRFRRQGHGCRLLPQLLAALPAGWRVEAPLPDRAPAGRFLAQAGFRQGHEELSLFHDLVTPPGPPAWPTGSALQLLPRRRAAAAFVPLYDATFAPHPWYQPYTVAEVERQLDPLDSLWFLTLQGRQAAFLWLQRDAAGPATIEPLGVLPVHQGQGFGRLLLKNALTTLAGEGADGVLIGAWADNLPALALYERLGFQLRKRTCFWVWTHGKN